MLTDAGIAYSVCGGVAVCLHGYQRNTTDLGLIIRAADSDVVRRVLTEAGYVLDSERSEFRTEDDIALLNRFASHTELNPESPIYQVMCMVGEDIVSRGEQPA